MALQIVGIGSFDGGVIYGSAVVGRCQQRSRIKTLVVGIPQAQLLHHFRALCTVVGQIGLAVLCQHTLVAGAVFLDLVTRRLVADDAVYVLGPHTAVAVVVECRGGHADHGVGRAVEHGAPGQFDSRYGHGLPVVGAARGVLHQVDLLQVRRIGKGLVTDEELEERAGVKGLRISILEVNALHLRLASESLIGHTGQMGVTGEVAHQVIQDIHLTVLGHAFLVDRGGHEVVAVGIDIPAVFSHPPSVAGRRVHVGIEIAIPVVLRDICVLHTFVSVGVVFA